MIRNVVLVLMLAAAGGCSLSNSESHQATTPNTVAVATPPDVQTTPKSESPHVELTADAKNKLQEYLKLDPSRSIFLLSVEFDDEKSCTGRSYHLRLGEESDIDGYELIDSDGFQIAMEKKHLAHLNGLKIHWLSISDELGGFHFVNPKDKDRESGARPNGNPESPAPSAPAPSR